MSERECVCFVVEKKLFQGRSRIKGCIVIFFHCVTLLLGKPPNPEIALTKQHVVEKTMSSKQNHDGQSKFPLSPFKKVWHKLEGLLDHNSHAAKEGACGRCDKILGIGSGGIVKRFQKEGVGELAKKEFHHRHSKESEKQFLKRITAEYCIASTLQHENIIKTYDLDLESEKHAFMVMEYQPHDLLQILQAHGREMGVATLDCYLAQLVRGVCYLHECGIAHRDLKLENILVSPQGSVKIIDFGSAQVVKTPFSPPQLSYDGPHGSDPYVSPEAWLHLPYDAFKVDIWAIGIIAIAMRDLQFPWTIAKPSDLGFIRWYLYQTHDQCQELVIKRWLLGSVSGDDLFWEMIKGTLNIRPKDRWDIGQVTASKWNKSVDACGGGKKGARCSHDLETIF